MTEDLVAKGLTFSFGSGGAGALVVAPATYVLASGTMVIAAYGDANAIYSAGRFASESFNAISSGNSGSSPKLTSSIHNNSGLVKAAEEMGKNERIQQEANHLILELLRGNKNPGIGTKNLFKDIYYLRGKNGARVFYRATSDGYEILAKASKANEQTVINILRKLYE